MNQNPEKYQEMMELWISIASDFGQLAVAALILPVFFLRKILGIPETKSLKPYINRGLYLSWASLLSSIALSMLYRGVAICKIGSAHGLGTGIACWFNPHIVFILFSLTFTSGIALFIVGAITAKKNE